MFDDDELDNSSTIDIVDGIELNVNGGPRDGDLVPRKRARHAVVISDDEDEPGQSMALSRKTTTGAKPLGNKPRAKAGDYDLGTRAIIQTAIEIYCALLLKNDPYAQPVKELRWAELAWEDACKHHGVNKPHDLIILKLVGVHPIVVPYIRQGGDASLPDHSTYYSYTWPVQIKGPLCCQNCVWV